VVAITLGSREVPGRKGLWRQEQHNNDDDKKNNKD